MGWKVAGDIPEATIKSVVVQALLPALGEPELSKQVRVKLSDTYNIVCSYITFSWKQIFPPAHTMAQM